MHFPRWGDQEGQMWGMCLRWNGTRCPGVGPRASSGSLTLSDSCPGRDEGYPLSLSGWWARLGAEEPGTQDLLRGDCFGTTGRGLLRELCASATPSWALRTLDGV